MTDVLDSPRFTPSPSGRGLGVEGEFQMRNSAQDTPPELPLTLTLSQWERGPEL